MKLILRFIALKMSILRVDAAIIKRKKVKRNGWANSPVANYKGEIFSMPFNMYTFNKMWGVVTPQEAEKKINEQRAEITGEPQNLEEQAISLVGRDIYEKLVKGYTEKQWGRDCKDLPAFIIKRLPVRMTFDNNYFNALYQGIPIGGYTKMVERMLDGIEVRLNCNYLEHKAELNGFNPLFQQPILVNLQQCGFSTSADASNNLNQLLVLKSNQLIQVFFPLNHHGHTTLLGS